MTSGATKKPNDETIAEAAHPRPSTLTVDVDAPPLLSLRDYVDVEGGVAG